jgi:hypothetical protein
MKLLPIWRFGKIVNHTLVDDDVYEAQSQYTWYANNWGYARRSLYEDSKTKIIYLHKDILGVGQNLFVDHADGNKINNLRENLRIATKSQNGSNRGRNRNNTSGFKGVDFLQSTEKWRARIMYEGVSHHLGDFDIPEEAHAAYVCAARILFREFANGG